MAARHTALAFFVAMPCFGPWAIADAPKIPPAPLFDAKEQAMACVDASRERFGEAHVITGPAEAPKSKKYVRPVLPPYNERRPGGVFWAGVALVAADGKVAELWPVRVAASKAPGPMHSKSILKAVSKWQWEPLMRDGTALPFCMTVTFMQQGN